ncbi:MAG: hypothetical protein JNK73_14655 [Bacteroidia bacterium]|nr:hypothetical protein [Bacteroidia bacterium]
MNPESEHCVIIRFDYGLDSLQPLHDLEIELDSTLKQNGHGDCDGHEIAEDLSDGILYLYGENAETIFKTVKPILEDCSFLRNSRALLRFGPPEDGVKEIELSL